MTRTFGVLAGLLLAAGIGHAHFPFILPDETGAAAKVVFSDALAPDTAVKIDKIDSTKLFLRDGTKNIPLEWKKGESWLDAKLPGAGNRVAFGVTEYGVLQKGDAKPFRLVYLSKAVIGDPFAKAVGDPLKVEIVATGQAGKTRFQVLASGAPAADIETTIISADEKKHAAKTDKDGFTPAFEGKGRVGVYARVSEAKSGEFAGKKFDEIRTYATLVVDIK
ncbi:MAG: DUF4198 domain-containing protein [Gemmataceae bacterium]